jgi:hypothetical protein
MNPSRLEATCKVTLDPVAIPLLDIILLALADIDLADWNNALSPKKDRTRNLPRSA